MLLSAPDPIPYSYPDGTAGATNNGDNVHVIQQNPNTRVWGQTAELNLGLISTDTSLTAPEDSSTIAACAGPSCRQWSACPE